MSPYNPGDWYQILVDQSRTNHIYDLIHEGLNPHFEPADEAGFVLIDTQDMPPGLQTVPLADVAKTSEQLDEDGKILIYNDRLTEYLEQATAMSVYKGQKGEYVLLTFKKHESVNDDNEDEVIIGRHLDGYDPEAVFDEDDSLMHCWSLIRKCQHKELALELAIDGHAYLDKKRLAFTHGAEAEYVKICFGYNIVAVAYAWNNRFDEAAIADNYYLKIAPFYKHLEDVIKPYLEMLIAKKQTKYLAYLFGMEKFKQHFLPHYEAYVSLLVNPHYECGRMRKMIPIINRVNNGLKQYL